MKTKDFNAMVRAAINSCLQTLTTKNKEYGKKNDKLHNFKVAARKKNITPEQALAGFKLKHDVSIDDIIDDTALLNSDDFKKKYGDGRLIEEKIGDEINYFLLLKGLLYERLNS